MNTSSIAIVCTNRKQHKTIKLDKAEISSDGNIHIPLFDSNSPDLWKQDQEGGFRKVVVSRSVEPIHYLAAKIAKREHVTIEYRCIRCRRRPRITEAKLLAYLHAADRAGFDHLDVSYLP